MRKLQQEREKKRLEAEEEKRKAKELLDRQIKAKENEMKPPEECSTSDCSVPVRVGSTSSNLGRFLECTTPVVSTQYLPLVITPILKNFTLNLRFIQYFNSIRAVSRIRKCCKFEFILLCVFFYIYV